MIQNLRKEGLEIIEHDTKADKVRIMMDAISNFKLDNRVIIPYNQECDYTMEWIEILKKEALGYSLGKKPTGKLVIGGKGVHDDMFSCLLFCLHYAQSEVDMTADAICID